jgi:DNA-binding NarL/FixJ family response regulator
VSRDSAIKANVLLVEDDPDQRDVLEIWLSESGYFLKSAKDGIEALALASQHPFDVVITDLKLPGLDGLQLLSLLKERDPSLIVIFVSGQATVEDVIAALREGRAYDFIQKPVGNLRQLNVIIEKALLKRQATETADTRCDCHAEPTQIEALSARELELARLLAKGCETGAIAQHMGLSEKTVRNNLSRLYEKLGVKNRTQAVLTCLQRHLL